MKHKNKSRQSFAGRLGATASWMAGCMVAVLAWHGGSARADELPAFTISGFGTVGGVYNDSDGAQFRRDISVPKGARANHWSFDQDSMLGVQATARISESFESTLQLVSRNSIGAEYAPQVSWAFLKWMPREDVALRFGRLAIDLYMQGDSAEIGYANLSVRQPVIFYPRTFDGVDADWITPIGAGTLRLKGQWGKPIGKLSSNGGNPYDTKGAEGRVFIAEYAQGGWTGRLSAGRLKLKNDPSDANTLSLYQALAMAPNGNDVLEAISLKDRRLNYVTQALSYDDGPVRGMVAHSVISSPNAPDLRSIYAQIGYRIEKFTPYVAYAWQKNDRKFVSTGIPWGLSAQTDAINQGSALAQTSMWANQSVVTLGLRYDLMRNAALKFQADRIRYQDPWSIVDPKLLVEDVGGRGFKHMNLFSAALEFVF